MEITAPLASFDRKGLIYTAYKPQPLIQHVYAWVIIFPVFQNITLQESINFLEKIIQRSYI